MQLLDGQVLAPSKSGLTATSVVGRNGRTTRMQVDGMDITDETVGATTTNIPVGAIQEVEVEPVAASAFFRAGFGGRGECDHEVRRAMIFTASSLATFATRLPAVADFPGGQDNSYSREVFGGNVGGAWKKDKLFYFLVGRIFQAGPRCPGHLQCSL